MKENTTRTVYTKAGTLGYLLKGSVFLFVVGIVANLLGTLFSMIIPQILSFAIDSVIGTKEVPPAFAGVVSLFGGIEVLKNSMWILAAAIVILAALQAILIYCRMYFTTRANQILMRRTRNKLFSHIQRLPLVWHIRHMTGDIIQRCTSDADTISNFITGQLINLVKIIIVMIISLVFMFIMNVNLALIATAFIPFILGVSVFVHTKARKRFKKCDEEEGVLSTIAQENFTGVRVVRAFGKEKYERDKFEKQNVYYTGLWIKVGKFMTALWAYNNFAFILQSMLLLVIGTVYCVNGTLTAGELVAFISYNTMLMGPVRQLGRIISNLSKAGVSLNRIAEILNAEEEVYGEAYPLSGDIEFKNAGFAYDEGKPVLSGINLKIPQGSTLGIIGGTGSGKSTLTFLLERLYPLTEGEILIGGQNINDISLAALRQNIGLILQEGHIYSRSVGENISIATDKEDLDTIRKYAQIACVDDNITGFANGYDTIVGERGVTLSGGQKQRVAIARTIMRETPYIIFDDSLSAVDSETDAAIRAKLKTLYKNATIIIISHRITTVMHADNIIVLDKGRIAESGTSEQLLKNNGIYSKLYDIQMSLPDELKAELKKEAVNG
ncbi:MAG: ABC transporter ATP-binding protein [Clostridia bacterium]|nr:ABC transporter ATP-binding protein [Clostridia bacterium]